MIKSSVTAACTHSQQCMKELFPFLRHYILRNVALFIYELYHYLKPVEVFGGFVLLVWGFIVVWLRAILFVLFYLRQGHTQHRLVHIYPVLASNSLDSQRQILNSSACLYLSSAGITSVYHYNSESLYIFKYCANEQCIQESGLAQSTVRGPAKFFSH